MSLRISIAQCTYNGERFLGEQLESYVQQTRPPDEIVVCDDMSSDRTLEILDEFAKRAPFEVRVFTNETNLGSTENFANAISRCSGDVIFLSDQDDVWLPNKIEKVIDQFADPDTGLVFTDAFLVNSDLSPRGERLWDHYFDEASERYFLNGGAIDTLSRAETVTGATMAFRSILIDLILPVPKLEDWIHDGWIAFVAATVMRVVPLRSPLIKYRQHADQQIGVVPSLVQPPGRLGPTRREAYAVSIQTCEGRKEKIKDLEQAFAPVYKKIIQPGSEWTLRLDPYDCLEAERFKLDIGISHHLFRAGLKGSRLSRIRPVVQELLSGRYTEFSRGARSAILDIVEKSE